MESRAGGSRPKDVLVIDDDWLGYPLHKLCVPRHYATDLETVLIPGGLIADRVQKLAIDIKLAIGSEPLTCLCVLKGGYKFFSDLVDQLKQLNSHMTPVPLAIDFIRLRSYVCGDRTQDEVEVVGSDGLQQLAGKNVLVVEDIIDTGRTITKLIHLLGQYNPKSVHVASLLVKRTASSCSYKPDFAGFEIPNKFVVGYAIDYNEYFRDLEHICVINDHGRQKYKVTPCEPTRHPVAAPAAAVATVDKL